MNRFCATLLVAVSLCGVLHVTVGAERPKSVIEIDQPQSIRLSWKNGRTRPHVIRTENELLKFTASRADVERIRRQVAFENQYLLVFVWEGDAQDRLQFKQSGSTASFVHWGNDGSDDPHLHCCMFAVNRNVEFEASIEPDPR